MVVPVLLRARLSFFFSGRLEATNNLFLYRIPAQRRMLLWQRIVTAFVSRAELKR
jgi:hypothetical protein